jgi:hypothetical protein
MVTVADQFALILAAWCVLPNLIALGFVEFSR